jgi:hypothetical protein
MLVQHSKCPEIDANICEELTFDKDGISIQWEKFGLAR